MTTTSVRQLVAATVERTNATGAVVPPAAGTVPTADGAGGAVWASGGAGGRVALRFNSDQNQTLYNDGVTRFVWIGAKHQVAFQAAAPWFGADRFGRWMSFAALGEEPISLITTGASIPIINAPIFISSGNDVPNESYRQLPGFTSSIVHWAVWPTAGDTTDAALFEGTIALAGGEYASSSITRSG